MPCAGFDHFCDNVNHILQLFKNIYHLFQAHFWRFVYGRPDKALHIYGVTGTNGKTTTSYILASILGAAYGEEKVGMLTTVAFRVGKKEVFNETKMTTLPSKLVYRYLKEMKDAKVDYVALEMTSHALDQYRVAGLRLDGAIFLNISPEHLNYHGTMERLLQAKMRIVHYLKVGVPFVVRQDLLGRISNFKFQISNDQLISFTVEQAKGVEIKLEGDVNRENVLAASLLMEAVGISKDVIAKGVDALTGVPGRMEWIHSGKGFDVVIDYAVTPDALERLYSYVKEKASGRVFGLLGAAGLRDRDKRPKMAAAVAKYADELVLTREDPWTENEEQIFSDLERGLKKVRHCESRQERDEAISVGKKIATPMPEASSRDDGCCWVRITDRREALKYLIDQAQAGDVIVVTGKGAERGMGIGEEVVSWNDREVIEDLVAV